MMGTVIANKNGSATPAKFRRQAESIASELLTQWVGEDRAAEACGRIATALAASAAAAKKPEEFYACTPASVAKCVAVSALTGIMPGTGPAALAYLIPRRPRKGEQPQLNYQLSHRGLNALTRRSGQTMIAVPIGHDDTVEVNADSDVWIVDRDIDNPPMTWDELRGVVLVVRELANGLIVARGWCPKKLIAQRRQSSDSFRFAENPSNKWAQDSSPWHAWPVEMAMKTAMHYAISRGWAVIDDTESTRALSHDASSDYADGAKAIPERKPRSLEDLSRELGTNETDTDPLGMPEDDAPPEAPETTDADETKAAEIHGLRNLAKTMGCPHQECQAIAEKAYYEHSEGPADWIATAPWKSAEKKQGGKDGELFETNDGVGQ